MNDEETIKAVTAKLVGEFCINQRVHIGDPNWLGPRHGVIAEVFDSACRVWIRPTCLRHVDDALFSNRHLTLL